MPINRYRAEFSAATRQTTTSEPKTTSVSQVAKSGACFPKHSSPTPGNRTSPSASAPSLLTPTIMRLAIIWRNGLSGINDSEHFTIKSSASNSTWKTGSRHHVACPHRFHRNGRVARRCTEMTFPAVLLHAVEETLVRLRTQPSYLN
jgi:hypothetical protein